MQNVRGTISVQPGEHVTPAAEVEATLLVMADDALSVVTATQQYSVLERRTEFEHRRIFYKLQSADGELSWMMESDAARMDGMYLAPQSLVGTTRGSLMGFVPPRPFTQIAGEYPAYPASSEDYSTSPALLGVPTDSDCQVASRVLIGSIPFVQVNFGEDDSYWVEWGSHFRNRSES